MTWLVFAAGALLSWAYVAHPDERGFARNLTVAAIATVGAAALNVAAAAYHPARLVDVLLVLGLAALVVWQNEHEQAAQ